jgi:hypothetical protein
MAVPTALRVPLRIVFYREGESWVAHCLEFDLLGHGPAKEDAIELLAKAVILQVQASLENQNPANLISPADGKYFRMYAAGTDVAEAILEIARGELKSASPMIDGVEAREFEDLQSEAKLVLS